MVDADASLQMWFDRGLDFGDGSLVDVQLGNLPRIVTSRSQDKQTTDSRLMSKREAKIVAVEMAICALLAVEPVGKENEKNARVYSWQSFLSRHLEMNFKRGLRYTMCSQISPKPLKLNRKIDVI